MDRGHFLPVSTNDMSLVKKPALVSLLFFSTVNVFHVMGRWERGEEEAKLIVIGNDVIYHTIKNR